MPDLHLPKPTTWNERAFGRNIRRPDFSQILPLYGWIDDEGNLYQPLFGLTAKDTKGKVRTVVEGDVIAKAGIGNGYSLWLVEHHEWSFRLQCIHNGERFYHDLSMLVEHNNLFTILCHATDIVAAGNKLTCWSCEGTGEAPKQCGEGTGLMMSKCPTCHGEGQHKIVWKK